MKKQYVTAFLIISVTSMAMIICSGALFSGYHFMDHSWFITMAQELTNLSVTDVLRNEINIDLSARFRPLWTVGNCLRVWVCGENLVLMILWQIFANILAAFAAYLLGRNLKWQHSDSLIFAGLILLGTQSAVFYQIGSAETCGLLFYLMSWYFILKYLNTTTPRKPLFYGCFVLASICAALSKESFIMALPATYVFYFWQSQTRSATNFVKTLKQTWKTLLLLAIFTFVFLSMMLLLVGSDFGYAGVEKSFAIAPYAKTAMWLWGVSGSVPLAILAIIYLLKTRKFEIQKWICPTLLFFVITLLQIVVYAKSGIIDRYLIPGIVGCAVIGVFTLQKLRENYNEINVKFWKNIFVALGIITLAVCAVIAFTPALQQKIVNAVFHIQGQSLQQMTSFASLQYLLKTISTVAFAGIVAGMLLVFFGLFTRKKIITKVSQLYGFGLYIVLILNLGLAFASCQRYTMRGFATENFLHTILDNTNENDAVLIVGNPLKDTEALSSGAPIWLHKYNRNNLYFFEVIQNEEEAKYIREQRRFYNNSNCESLDKLQFAAIGILAGSEKTFVERVAWFVPDDYSRTEFTGAFVVYTKK